MFWRRLRREISCMLLQLIFYPNIKDTETPNRTWLINWWTWSRDYMQIIICWSHIVFQFCFLFFNTIHAPAPLLPSPLKKEPTKWLQFPHFYPPYPYPHINVQLLTVTQSVKWWWVLNTELNLNEFLIRILDYEGVTNVWVTWDLGKLLNFL